MFFGFLYCFFNILVPMVVKSSQAAAADLESFVFGKTIDKGGKLSLGPLQKILIRIWKTRTSFDANRYIEPMRTKNHPLVQFLTKPDVTQ